MKYVARFGLVLTISCCALGVSAEEFNFGNDSSEWANDGECDDRRFYGPSMAKGLDRDDIGHDATDCRQGYQSGALKIWDFTAARAATQCNAIDFGDNSSEWPNDGQCDDYRFDGPGADYVLLEEDIKRDAADCYELCRLGQIALRDY